MNTTWRTVLQVCGLGIVLGVIAGLIGGSLGWPSWIPGAVVGATLPIIYFNFFKDRSK